MVEAATTPEYLTISGAGGEPDLAAVLHLPSRPLPQAAVVVAHGMLSSKESAKHVKLCERCARAGLTALRFDFRGRGASAGDPELLTVSNEIADMLRVIEMLHERGLVRLAFIGSSLGGTVALLTAARSEPVALVTMASPAHLATEPRPEWRLTKHQPGGDRVRMAPGVLLSMEIFRDAHRHDPSAAARGIRCPWRILHGAADEVVPVTEARQLAAANATAELLIHPDADHRFSTDAWRAWLVEHASEHVIRCLKDERESPPR